MVDSTAALDLTILHGFIDIPECYHAFILFLAKCICHQQPAFFSAISFPETMLFVQKLNVYKSEIVLLGCYPPSAIKRLYR